MLYVCTHNLITYVHVRTVHMYVCVVIYCSYVCLYVCMYLMCIMCQLVLFHVCTYVVLLMKIWWSWLVVVGPFLAISICVDVCSWHRRASVSLVTITDMHAVVCTYCSYIHTYVRMYCNDCLPFYIHIITNFTFYVRTYIGNCQNLQDLNVSECNAVMVRRSCALFYVYCTYILLLESSCDLLSFVCVGPLLKAPGWLSRAAVPEPFILPAYR